MKYDKSYSEELDECLTIYEIRELNFEEESDYDSEQDSFYCPDKDCRLEQGELSALTTVNAKKVKYKKTPHFKDTPKTIHRKSCPYTAEESDITYVDPDGSQTEGTKTTDYPIEFLLERRKYKKKNKTEGDGIEGEGEPNDITKTTGKKGGRRTKRSPNTTSIFEHIVECFLSNRHDKEKLKSMPLTIGKLSGSYNFFFKSIRYFSDREGLIYWGRVKQVRDYEYSFAIQFEDRVSNLSISAYINKSTIQNYHKQKFFTDKIRELILGGDDINCFFLGAYPVIKTIKKGDDEFKVYSVDITNLDHLLLRVID